MNARSAKIRWSRRVEPYKIRRLYESDAQGMLDEDLLDDVGYGIYVCCQESIVLEEAARGNVKCRNCGQTIVRRLVDGRFDDTEILKCRACGWEIWCGDYHRSLLRKAPARPYEPMHIFRAFVKQWPLARSPRDKLLLIDRLIHEWHVHYRAVGWPLGTTVVRATASQMVELLEGLAYGAGTTDGLDQTKKVWRDRLEARQMKFDLKAAARDLGIAGISRMRKRELIEAIERAAPQFFAPWLDLCTVPSGARRKVWLKRSHHSAMGRSVRPHLWRSAAGGPLAVQPLRRSRGWRIGGQTIDESRLLATHIAAGLLRHGRRRG